MRYVSFTLGIIGLILILHNGYWFWKGVTRSEESKQIEVVDAQNVQPLKINSYIRNVDDGEQIGILSIPVLQLNLPIFYGTSENELKRGVGHYVKSGLPGENRHIVLTGHRDTVFRKLEAIEKDEDIWIETSAGKYLYRVLNTRIVEKDDRTVLVEKSTETLTLVTCYPFRYIGSAPERFIVTAELVE
jgi:sortase A